MTSGALLLGVALFEVKHFVADYLLQSKYVVFNKGRYGHPGGLLHVAIHMAASVPVLLALAIPLPGLIATILCEGIVHYHLDWAKDRLQARLRLTTTDRAYWALFGTDQLLHQFTYIAMLWVWMG